MRTAATTFCVWVAAITLAVSVGGNLFQAVVVDPVWSGSPPESLRTFAKTPYFERLKTFHTNPLFLVGLACLLAAPVLAWNQPSLRNWLLMAAVLYLVVILGTLLYFYPLNDVLLARGGGGLDTATVVAMTRRWVVADRIRYLFRLASFLCLLRAMTIHGIAK
jgi:Anthrone oxygenase